VSLSVETLRRPVVEVVVDLASQAIALRGKLIARRLLGALAKGSHS